MVTHIVTSFLGASIDFEGTGMDTFSSFRGVKSVIGLTVLYTEGLTARASFLY
jgi:hypothetical protein